MKLFLPHLLDALDLRRLLILSPLRLGHMLAIDPSPKTKLIVQKPLRQRIVKARKYIFDSGCYDDGPDSESIAVDRTSVAMLGAGLFHLPAPAVWIEDYFEDNPTVRQYIFAWEDQEGIHLWAFIGRGEIKMSLSMFSYEILIGHDKSNYFDPHPLLRDCDIPGHGNFAELIGGPDKHCTDLAGAFVFAVKKFVVCLAAQGIEKEEHQPNPRMSRGQRHPDYAYTVLRVPYERLAAEQIKRIEQEGRRRPRMHMVAGHLRFRDRPLEEQIWIAPYFRCTDQPAIPDKAYEVRLR